MKPTLTLVTALLLATLSAAQADESSDQQKQIKARRTEYLHWIVENFGKLEPAMDARDGRRWALNHARLVLGRDVGQANGYFESFAPPAGDSDIYFIRFLRTLLDCRDEPRLSDEAEARIVGFLKQWPQNALTSRAHWPPRFTENHDLMNLTLGLFAQVYRDSDISGHEREIKKFIAHRMERGFVETPSSRTLAPFSSEWESRSVNSGISVYGGKTHLKSTFLPMAIVLIARCSFLQSSIFRADEGPTPNGVRAKTQPDRTR